LPWRSRSWPTAPAVHVRALPAKSGRPLILLCH